MIVQKFPEIQEKPFACTAKGCDMTFTNKDHLEWHNKKHELMLNLSNKNNNEIADQTPTPTRFIRNCEEVGLFQDLQNVNPFDDIFKKAADLAKNGVTIEFQSNNSNDTLHTPHILPHITNNQLKTPTVNNKNDSDCEPFDFTTNNSNSNDSVMIIDLENSSDDKTVQDKEKNPNIKKKIKENLLNKKLPRIKVVPWHNLRGEGKNKPSKEKYLKSMTRTEVVREMNRAAQNRCRKKKKQAWKEMEQEIASLRKENKRLKLELVTLKLEHDKCTENARDSGSITSTAETPETSNTESKIASPIQMPLLIQILPNTLIIPTTTDPEDNVQSSTSQEVETENKTKARIKRSFRKIAPRILIENS